MILILIITSTIEIRGVRNGLTFSVMYDAMGPFVSASRYALSLPGGAKLIFHCSGSAGQPMVTKESSWLDSDYSFSLHVCGAVKAT